jgi:hypothetical protein
MSFLGHSAHFIDGNKDVTWGDVGLQLLTAGQSTSAVASNVARRQAERQAGEEKARLQQEQDRRNGYVAQIRDLFGVGTGAGSAANGQRIADYLNQFYRDKLGSNLSGVTEGFSGASRVSRQNLARAGQLGSGLDTSAQAGNLADFLRGRQRAVGDAAKARDDLSQSFAGLRTNLENSVSSGSLTNPDFASFASQQKNLFDTARANIVPNQIGQVFRQAGDTYYNGATQQAQGNQGLRAFGFGGGGSAGGRIT